MKTVLVTGGAGFIGSHLCRALIDAGNQVICVDNLYTGSKENITELLADKNFTFIEHDVTAPLPALNVNQIYNLACPASPVHYQQNAVKTLLTSLLGTHQLLELAKKCKARLLQASTSEVYGDPLEHPQKESYWGNVNPIGIRSCYDEGKRAAETLIMDYHRQFGVDVKIARIFNTYGPAMAFGDGRVVSNFIVQSLAGKPLTVYGDGKQTRSFCYVSDLVAGLMAFMESSSDLIGPINLGNPAELTIKEMGEKIIELCKSSSEIAFDELPEDDPRKRQPDISLAREKLSWEPEVGFEEGLKKTIAYFKEV